jgi:hypothetical protein
MPDNNFDPTNHHMSLMGQSLPRDPAQAQLLSVVSPIATFHGLGLKGRDVPLATKRTAA